MACDLPRHGLRFLVNHVETEGDPPQKFRVWATLQFLASDSPFCCGEPGCHLGLFAERLQLVAEHLSSEIGLGSPVSLDFVGDIGVNYHQGVEFRTNKDIWRDNQVHV